MCFRPGSAVLVPRPWYRTPLCLGIAPELMLTPAVDTSGRRYYTYSGPRARSVAPSVVSCGGLRSTPGWCPAGRCVFSCLTDRGRYSLSPGGSSVGRGRPVVDPPAASLAGGRRYLLFSVLAVFVAHCGRPLYSVRLCGINVCVLGVPAVWSVVPAQHIARQGYAGLGYAEVYVCVAGVGTLRRSERGWRLKPGAAAVYL